MAIHGFSKATLLSLLLFLLSVCNAASFTSENNTSLDEIVKSSNASTYATTPSPSPQNALSCRGIPNHADFSSSCSYLKATVNCDPEGYIDYLRLYYCTLQNFHFLRSILLILWPLALFFMLGNTAADFFCPALEEISQILHIPPTVAGVTLLPLGNGSTDVFASIAAFAGAGAGDVGLNSVLGAGVFISTVVAGCICIVVGSMNVPVAVDKFSFYRDVSFYLFSLLTLLLFLYFKEINLLHAVLFVLIYVLYGSTVAITELWRIQTPNQVDWLLKSLSLKKKQDRYPLLNIHFTEEEESRPDSIYESLLPPVEIDSHLSSSLPSSLSSSLSSFPSSFRTEPNPLLFTLPQWKWTSNVAIFSRSSSLKKKEFVEEVEERKEGEEIPLWGWMEEEKKEEERKLDPKWLTNLQFWVDTIVKFPLTFPIRLTVPVCRKEAWSYPHAIFSVFFSPILLTFVLSQHSTDWKTYALAAIFGSAFAFATFVSTSHNVPPTHFPIIWVSAEFIMSILWFYLLANELVAYLLFAGVVLRLNSALLGLTVLAWGNSVGDFVANLAMAYSGTKDSVQIAWSGCFAGPLFNTLLGLGGSFVIMAWRSFPGSFSIPQDPSLPWTIAVASFGLVVSLIVLPLNEMKLSRSLGFSLLLLYSLFMVLRGWTGFRSGDEL